MVAADNFEEFATTETCDFRLCLPITEAGDCLLYGSKFTSYNRHKDTVLVTITLDVVNGPPIVTANEYVV